MNNIESLKSYFSSEIILVIGIIALIFVSLRNKNDHSSPVPIVIAIVVLFLSLSAAISTHFATGFSLFHGMLAMDQFGQFFKIIIIGASLVTVVFSSQSKDLENTPRSEFLIFLLALTLGLNIMVSASNLLMMYLAIEMASIVSYVMAGYMTENKRSDEASLKYVLYGGVASGVMVFGMSLLYGLTGTLNLLEIREVFVAHSVDQLVLFMSFVMILAGLGYKMAIAPFHMWAPDVYQGAPLPVTAFLSVASKAAGFAITLRFLFVGFIVVESDKSWSVISSLDWQILLAILSAVTMTVGNLLALQQNNIKRFLAYSSIAHAGYMLMGVAVQSTAGVESILFYFIVYFLMNLGAFLVAGLVLNQLNTEEMSDYKGLVRQGHFGAFLALSMTVFLFSLVGIPPFAGFIGKWYVFKSVVASNISWLAIIGALNSVVSLYYYVRLIKFMIIDKPLKEKIITHTHWRFTSLIAVFAVFTLFFGIYFEPLVEWVKISSKILH